MDLLRTVRAFTVHAIVLSALSAACAPRPAPPLPEISPGAPGAPPAARSAVEAPSAAPVEVRASEVAVGLEAPWAVAFTPDGRAFVTERDSGRILEVDPAGGAPPREVHRLDVRSRGEGGLLGLAVSPEWPRNNLLYAYLTSHEGDNRIVRFRPGQSAEPILTGIPAASVHDGGRLVFGPDGMLYAATGDATERRAAQDLGSLAGKILRMTGDGQPAPGNPFPSSLVYSYGHRNVQGLAFAADGTLYATEYGPDRDDEINRIEAGANYGWPAVTGEAGGEGYVDPLFVVSDTGEASWSGAAILSGGAIPQWEDSLFAAALRGERLYRFTLASDGGIAGVQELLTGELGRLRDVVQAPDGALWVLTNNRDGRGEPFASDDRIIRLGS